MNETIYSVKLRYTVDDRAGAGVKNLTKDVAGLGDMSGKVVGLISGLAAGFLGFESAKKHLIDFNSEVQNAKIGLSAMIQGNLGTSWDRATQRANNLYNEFQKFSTLTPVTTQEILGFGKSIAVATFQAGGSMKQLTNITEQGVIAAKAFGYESAYSALELSEMLSGNVNKRMMFAKQLLGIAKVDEKEFNAMSSQDRLGVVQKVLNSDAMKNAATAFGASWSGVLSTLEDKLQILVGKVGLPLFETLKKEMKSASLWLDTHTQQVDAFTKTFGDGLVSGFHAMKDAVGFLVDHASTLLKIGEVYAAVKIGGMLGGSMKNGGEGAVGKIAGMLAWGRGTRLSDNGRAAGPAWNDAGIGWDGGYKIQSTTGGGRKAMGLGDVAGSLPALGQAFGAGYGIGSIINERTGASGNLADAFAHLTGRVDAATDHFDRLAKSDDLLESAMAHRRSDSSGGGVYNANLLGMIDKYKGDINAQNDLQRAWRNSGGDLSDDNVRKTAAAWDARGVSGADVDRERGALGRLQNTQSTVMLSTLGGFNAGLAKLNATQLKSLDSTQAIEEIQQYMLASNDARNQFNAIGGVFASGFAKQQQIIADTILATNSSGKMSAKPNVNITIQRIEVQSEDPDRYAFGLVEAFKDALKNPSAAVRTIREG